MMSFFKTLLMPLIIVLVIWLAFFAAYTKHIKAQNILSIPKTDAIIVFTGGANRVSSGLDLLEKGAADRLYISGVNTSVTLQDILVSEGKADKNLCCITLDYKSETTLANARTAAEWVNKNNIKSIILVTSDFHMPRSRFEFHKAVKDIEVYPYPVNSDKPFLELAKEFNKFVAVWGISWFL